MPRNTLAVELNTFIAGLITEATPLTFPANASLEEDNFVLSRKGSRQRRFGMDIEQNGIGVVTDIPLPISNNLPITTFRWRNAGGVAGKDFLVVQVASQIKVFDLNSQPISQHLVFTADIELVGFVNNFSYAVVDGLLVIASGSKDITIIEYTPDVGFSTSKRRLKVRDQFGLEAIVDGVNLREGNGVSVRPVSLDLNHIYNLRNQTFADPRKPEKSESLKDPISEFFSKSSSKYPSNSDAVNYALYADTNDEDDRLTERFIAKDLVSNPVGTFPAPKGYFIIDVLDRGSSRLQSYNDLLSRNPSLQFPISSLPVDSTPGGAKVIAEYAGRVWYSGFPGEVVEGDAHSPRLASYVLFSQLVDDISDISACYQNGDPTSKEDPDLVDTDGGFIRIDGAYGIVGLVNVSSSIMVVATNGVWMIQGGSDYGFKATNYLVTKITNRGCVSAESIVTIDNTFMYWADDGIYTVAPNQFGDYEATNITRSTIQTLYDDLDSLVRSSAKGVYDTYTQKVRWVYNNRFDGVGPVKELVLDTTIGAFYTNTINNLGSTRLPLVIGGTTMPPFMIDTVEDPVVVDTDPVLVNGDEVVVSAEITTPNVTEVVYLIITGTSPTVSLSFGLYRNDDFTDWKSRDGIGVDAKAHLLTGWLAGGDYQRYKQVPYVTFHFSKTEDGFEEDASGDWIPTHQSSCLVSAQWDWANSANSGQWGKQFQAYRFKRHYFPADISDNFNNGYQTVISRSKLRGKGRVLSLLIETEPKKDCQLLGWSMVMTSNGSI